MNQKLIVLFLLFFSICQAQEDFKNGYIISNSGDRQEVLIYDYNWKSNPTSITYKKSEDGEKLKGNLTTISEFGILDEARYQRAKVKIEGSSEDLNNLSTRAQPEFETKSVFLKVLVDGEADLLLHTIGRKKNYFIRVDDAAPIVPLVYKKYQNTNGPLKENTQYKQQLFNNLTN